MPNPVQFAKTYQYFFTALASKKNFLDSTTLTEPIGSLLGLLRTGLNSLAGGVIALVPTCGAKARDELKDLDKTLGEAISAFTVHAPTTPGIQPPVATNPPLNVTNHPIPAPLPAAPLPAAPLPGVVGSLVSGPIGSAAGKPTEISATGPAVAPVAAPVGGQ